MLGLKLNHVSKRGHWQQATSCVIADSDIYHHMASLGYNVLMLNTLGVRNISESSMSEDFIFPPSQCRSIIEDANIPLYVLQNVYDVNGF